MNRGSVPGPPAPPAAAAHPVTPDGPVRVALRATVLGLALAVALLAAVLLLGVVPSPRSCWAGLALAAITTTLGNLVLAVRLLDRSVGSVARLAPSVFADLALHTIVGGGTVVALFLVRTKFLDAPTFALAFAASVVVMRITGAVVLSRALMSAATRPRPEREPRPQQSA